MNDENTVPASQASTVLNLSTDSGFYTDWKQEYQLDTEQAILSAGRTESIMLSTTRLISTLCTLLKLPHSVEFSSIDTLERFLVTVIDDAEGTSARNFVQQMPLYVFSVLSLIKHSLLLGAVERFSKEFILTLGIARKDFVGSIGVKLLRVVYAQKHHIYSSLRPSIKCEDMFVRFKSNKLILAAATVTAMLKFCGAVQERVVDQVVNQLSNECFVEPKNIIFLRDAILNVFN
ncbi:uncharacterized protein LOC131684574 isoform X2 [Topomyia yanbarensis]|uniref:uncharacterized protein LOC131684574 isoform X2 n=1 Tax=Topomyia yanbarensis TaxID=2498891 RepID=UPI00273C6E2A|nr:uncharacterized protein LOC131684574 isoform X2 [Topomyia yanbarensis]